MTSRRRWRPAQAAAALAVLLSCARFARATLPDELGSALIVLPGAKNVQTRSAEGGSGTSYDLDVPFPAAAPILEIVKRLEKLGWTALKEDSFNPGIPTSMVRGWTSFIDASKPVRVRRYSWASDWADSRGDRAYYVFRYEAPEAGQTPLRSLKVMGSVVPADLHRRMEADASRAMKSHDRASPRGVPLPPGVEGAGHNVLEASAGDAFLASGPGGEAVVQITGTPGDQVAYRWRFRPPDGKEAGGSVPLSATLQAGPFRLSWMPRSPFTRKDGLGGVGYHAEAMDLIPIPGDQFESLDLGQAHALATLLPDRNARYAAVRPPSAERKGDRLNAFMEAGRGVSLGPGRALLLRGDRGAAVVDILEPQLRSVKYRWRFRENPSRAETSGQAEASESPFPELKAGPYVLLWQMGSLSKERDAAGTRILSWSADVKYLPEDVSVETIPAEDFSKLDLARTSANARRP